MTLLLLDTCTERLIVGVRGEADSWLNLDTRALDGPGTHARDILPAVDAVLAGARPDAVAVAVGPGSFTGVRIGLATAKGLAEGWGVPILGLDNLSAMATTWRRLQPASPAAVLVAIDARKRKFYGSLTGPNGELVPASDLDARGWREAARQWKGPVTLSGYQGSLLASELSPLPEGWTVLDLHDWAPALAQQAEDAWLAGRFLDPDAGPRYLRLSEAEEALRAKSR